MMLVALCILFSSCNNSSELADKSQVRINVDWSGYGKNMPTGMTVVCYHAESGENTRIIENNISCVTPRLSPGRHYVTMFNLTEGEFGNIRFRGLESVEAAEAYAAVHDAHDAPKWYTPSVDDDSYIAGQPEWFAVDSIHTKPVLSLSDDGLPDMEVIGTLHPKNIVYTLHVTVRTDNIGNLRAVRGTIGGLASGRRFAGDRPNDNDVTVTHIIDSDSWIRQRTSSSSDIGLVKADVRCFGLPGNHQGTPGENRLELQVMLADGKTVMRYELPVGHLIKESVTNPDRRGDNLDLYLDVQLDPPLPPGTGSSGLDVWLDEWDDEVDFDVPI